MNKQDYPILMDYLHRPANRNCFISSVEYSQNILKDENSTKKEKN